MGKTIVCVIRMETFILFGPGDVFHTLKSEKTALTLKEKYHSIRIVLCIDHNIRLCMLYIKKTFPIPRVLMKRT